MASAKRRRNFIEKMKCDEAIFENLQEVKEIIENHFENHFAE